ncbi:DUF413 domain-containing protein [Neptuniibacter marinus]|uniref:DUF413 domain-containing protein n=1 Tax=Neptuniibacter marinus TaxID=1806670 RepID=UPI00082C5BEF|nr:DUF413 domain-containing protein [Neptuniibacter marinus]
MQLDDAFKSDKRFRDPKNFPYGFARSGEFTREQAQLIENHGYAYIELASGARAPLCDQEQAFMAFCQGDKDAESLHERTWKRYQDKVNRKINCYTLASIPSVSDDDASDDDD